MTSFDVTLGSSFAEHETSKGEWDALLIESDQNHVFLSEGWLRAWSATIGAGGPMIIAKVRQAGRLVAAAAFQATQGVVEFAGKGPSDYSDFIIHRGLSTEEAAGAVGSIMRSVRASQSRFDHFYLGRILDDSQTLAIATRLGRGLYPTVCPGRVAPCMEMAAAEEKLKKKSLIRNERSLQRLGAVTDETYVRADDILPLLDLFFDQHVARWQDTDSPSLFLDPVNREFYKRFIVELDPTGWLRFMVIKLDDRIVACHCGFLSAGRFIWYKPTFDYELKKMSPGEVLIKRLIERAQTEGADEFDFTIGGEAFKFRFATKIRHVVNLHVTDSWLKAAVKRTRMSIGKKLAQGKANAVDA